MYNKRCENIIKRITDFKTNNNELEHMNIVLQKDVDELKKKLSENSYQLAIKENKLHYLNNKLIKVSLEYEKNLEAIKKENNQIKIDEISSKDNNLNSAKQLEYIKAKNSIKELEYLKSTNTYKIWIIYKRLPEWIRRINRALLTPFKLIFRLLKKLN